MKRNVHKINENNAGYERRFLFFFGNLLNLMEQIFLINANYFFKKSQRLNFKY